MRRHLDRELEGLREDLLYVGSLVKEQVQLSVRVLLEGKVELAEAVCEKDRKVDQKEVEIEEECLKILALHQPVAEDLRLIAAVLKINNDLERMGDEAVSIARRSAHLGKAENTMPIPEEILKMVEISTRMMDECLQAFVQKDAAWARRICAEDDAVDALQRKVIADLRIAIKDHPQNVDLILDMFNIARRLERLADLATNIAEDVVYLVEGEIIRHGSDRPSHQMS